MIIEKFIEIDEIKVFHNDINDEHPDYNVQGLDNLYNVEEKYFWFLARKDFIALQMEKYGLKQSKIIEIGAGTGNVSRYLLDRGYTDISVGDMHLNGLKYAKSYGIKDCYQFDLLRSPFESEFPTVCMFDVLEHIQNSHSALQNVHKMLSKEGYLVITVPAHGWLWNRGDAIAGHKKRYTRNILISELKECGFDPILSRYFFISIIPLLFLRCFVNKDDGSQITKEEYSQKITINPLINKILSGICLIENRLNQYLPNWFGGSLLVVARKT